MEFKVCDKFLFIYIFRDPVLRKYKILKTLIGSFRYHWKNRALRSPDGIMDSYYKEKGLK